MLRQWVVVGALLVGVGCGASTTEGPPVGDSEPSDDSNDANASEPLSGSARPLDRSAGDSTSQPSAPTTTPSEMPGTGDFIPWTAFEGADSFGLGSHARLHSAVAHVGYGDEELVVSVSSESGSNRVLGVDLDGQMLRAMPLHLDCGDCRVGSSGLGVLLANSEGLWESRDGGYRFAQRASWPFVADGSHVKLEVLAGFGQAVWAKLGGQWLTTQDGSSLQASWSGGMASVGATSALEVTARYVARHGDEPATSANPCTALDAPYGWGTSWHLGAAALVSCGAAQVAFTPDLGTEDFVMFQLDAPVERMLTRNTPNVYMALFVTGTEPDPDEASVLIATARSWYVFQPETRELSRVAIQAQQLEGDQVIEYLDDTATRGVRVSTLGVALSPYSY